MNRRGRPKGASDVILRSRKHSFARQFLADHNIEIYRGSEPILTPVNIKYPIKLPNTRYYVGEQFVERGVTKKINSYQEVMELGFVISSRKVKEQERWGTNQQVVYELKRPGDVRDYLEKMPSGKFGVHVEHDTFNKQVRIVGVRTGPLGYGPWIDIIKQTSDEQVIRKPVSYRSYSKRSDEIIENQLRDWLGIDKKPKPVHIKEAAFMISESNEIVCFPKTGDMPSILITGMKGTGKSFAMNSLTSRFFWKQGFNYKIAIMNDSSRETGTWCLPNDNQEQIYELAKLNEKPLPLPMVYLHPMVKDEYEKLYMGDVGFDITIPFKEIVENHKDYLKIEGSARYFTKFKDNLKACETQQQAEAFMDTIGITFNVPTQTVTKIRAEMDTLFDTRMTDISSKKQKPWSTSLDSDKYYNPLTACLRAGLIPVLETEYVSNRPEVLAIYFRYFAADLFNRQKQDMDFVEDKSELMIVVDEVHNISGTAATRNSGADLLLRRCVREGRPRRIGTLLATQKFGELPDVIKDNSMFLLCFKNPGEATKIANQYNMGTGVANMIKDLDKFECIAYSTEHFVVYDTHGNRRKSRPNEVFKGRVLPPYSLHKKPTRGK